MGARNISSAMDFNVDSYARLTASINLRGRANAFSGVKSIVSLPGHSIAYAYEAHDCRVYVHFSWLKGNNFWLKDALDLWRGDGKPQHLQTLFWDRERDFLPSTIDTYSISRDTAASIRSCPASCSSGDPEKRLHDTSYIYMHHI